MRLAWAIFWAAAGILAAGLFFDDWLEGRVVDFVTMGCAVCWAGHVIRQAWLVWPPFREGK